MYYPMVKPLYFIDYDRVLLGVNFQLLCVKMISCLQREICSERKIDYAKNKCQWCRDLSVQFCG